MLKQIISRSSKAIYSGSRIIAQRPLVGRSQFLPTTSNSLRAGLLPSFKWYSDQSEPPAKKEGEEPTAQAAEAPAEAQAEAQDGAAANAPSNEVAELKKKLEAKEKEVIEWKVCTPDVSQCKLMQKNN